MVSASAIWDTQNLERAWRWTRSNPDAAYKRYFREHFAAYASGSDALIADLADRLRRGIYEPQPVTKIYLPKASGILRPYSLMSVEDQICYQAAVNVVADQLLPRAKGRYLKEVFGHLYAGRSGPWFYRKWSNGYREFNRTAVQAFDAGLRITASFDLTACYDSIDHTVIAYFLRRLGLNDEFCRLLTRWLGVWTATETEIRHGHGIPQGPLPSGLLAEVVLGHFDDQRRSEKSVRYLRYVDDIRLFARRERDLRKMLIRLDRLSKDVGLFPQSSKISIHEVKDIRKELKSVSQPIEAVTRATVVPPAMVRKRLRALSKRYVVSDPTRFKYVLAFAAPSAELTRRLWRIYEAEPTYYAVFARYLSKYAELPPDVCDRIVSEIESNDLYAAVQAAFVNAMNSRMPAVRLTKARSRMKKLWRPKSQQPDLTAALARWLLPVDGLSGSQPKYILERSPYWWLRAEMVLALATASMDPSVREGLLNLALGDDSPDVAVAAAWTMGQTGTAVTRTRREIHHCAKPILKEFGLIRRGGPAICGISHGLQKLVGTDGGANWRRFFGSNYRAAERQLVECRAHSETSATAWVNSLDVFNDWLLSSLYARDSSLGTYALGNIGSVLNSRRLAAKYPAVSAFANDVHDRRYESNLSHPKVGRTGKVTRRIPFSYLRTSKRLLKSAVVELGRQF